MPASQCNAPNSVGDLYDPHPPPPLSVRPPRRSRDQPKLIGESFTHTINTQHLAGLRRPRPHAFCNDYDSIPGRHSPRQRVEGAPREIIFDFRSIVVLQGSGTGVLSRQGGVHHGCLFRISLASVLSYAVGHLNADRALTYNKQNTVQHRKQEIGTKGTLRRLTAPPRKAGFYGSAPGTMSIFVVALVSQNDVRSSSRLEAYDASVLAHNRQLFY